MAQPEARSAPSSSLHREVVSIGLLTLVGAAVRLAGLGRLGLVHFDEGIYARAGLWPFVPGGLAGVGPGLIAYAPPGYPVLVGLANLVLGGSLTSGIVVSIAAGIATVPVVAWLAHRAFGPIAGVAAAAFASLSAFHAAYSRMALTDASFLLVFLVALGLGMRFLERPTVGRAAALGLAVGVAQLFKYSGWIAGAVVPLTALAGLAVEPADRQPARLRRVWGLGLLAAAISALAYSPWYAFVETNGGYSALLRHQRGYLGDWNLWYDHWRVQLEQVAALSGGVGWNAAGYVAAIAAIAWLLTGTAGPAARFRATAVGLAIGPVLCLGPTIFWWIGPARLVAPWRGSGQGDRLLRISWLTLAVLTPFYHPYARLWLPLQAAGWILAGGAVLAMLGPAAGVPPTTGSGLRGLPGRLLLACSLLAVLQGVSMGGRGTPPVAGAGLPGPVAPTDSLGRAVTALLMDLPAGVDRLRVLARPPVALFLAGRVGKVEPALDSLLAPRGDGSWAVVDLAQLRQEGDLRAATGRLLGAWELVGEYPSRLSLPALLDADPAAARAGASEAAEAPVWLLRPKGGGGER